jgi:hypothetical protein
MLTSCRHAEHRCVALWLTHALLLCCPIPRRAHCGREELAALNRSIQSTAKSIKGHLEGLSRDRAAMPEPQQAKLRKLMQDFAAALQVVGKCCGARELS